MDHAARKQAPNLKKWVDGFILAKRAEGLSPRTVDIYQKNLTAFLESCLSHAIEDMESITPEFLRGWLLALQAHRTPGGAHQFYRTVKTFLRWYDYEAAPPDWRNPITRVKAPKLPENVLEPVSMETVRAMVAACSEHDREGTRDKAILLTLLDTGARAAEMCAFRLGDFNEFSGALSIVHGKGGKNRTVFVGVKCRRAIRAYLRTRGTLEESAPLFANQSGRALTYPALRGVIERRAATAGVDEPSLHDFRRQFTLSMLRAGVDLLTLQRLLGHADLSTLRLYAKLTVEDLREAHEGASPVDKLNL